MVVTKIKLPAVLTKDPDDECPIINLDTDGNIGIYISNHLKEAVELLSSEQRTADGSGNEIDVGRFETAEICIDVTAVSGTFAAGEGLRVFIEGKDEISGKWKTLYDSLESLGEMITSVLTDWFRISDLTFRILRVRWEITGTTPAFSFGVSSQMKV